MRTSQQRAATANAGEDHKLELRVVLGDGQRCHEVVVHAGDDHLVCDLAAEAARLLGAEGEVKLRCERRRQVLQAQAPLRDAGIRWGDRLMLADRVVEPTHVGGPGRVELTVTAGPCAGQRFELGEGQFRLGRDPQCDIHLSDPSLSRHHLDVAVSAQEITIADAGSSNGSAIDGQRLEAHSRRQLAEHEELEIGRTMARIRLLRLPSERAPEQQRDGRLDFNRPPRVSRPPEPFRLDLAAPPGRGRRARMPLAASLLPLAAGAMLFVLMKSPAMLAIAGLSPLMAIGTYVSDRRGGRKAFERGRRRFRQSLTEGVERLDGELREEAARRRASSPDAASLLARAHRLSSSLWERRPADADFMCLRIGVADMPAQSAIVIADGGSSQLRTEAEGILDGRRTVASVPVTVDMRKVGVLGLAGWNTIHGLARWLLLQAAILHSPGDLVILGALTPESAAEWSWLKWLPHLRPRRVGLETQGIAVGRADAESLLAEVHDLVEQRRSHRSNLVGRSHESPQLLVVIDERTGVDRSLVNAAFSDAAQQGVAAIWLGRETRDLPGLTGAIVEAEQRRAVLTLTDVASGERVSDVSADAVSAELAEETARRLAPLRDVGELAGAGDIPKRVGLLDLLELLPPTSAALRRRWEQWGGDLAITVGAGAGGSFSIDLRDEGPHALIVGTTGSGKSELLRTFVAAAAATVPPDRLVFVLVDYKGGAAFAPCATLPHVLDVVSDLDEHLGKRALISLNAELKRRERILAEHQAKDLLDLIARNRQAAPPLLVIAIDEFAKLREEIPEFVDGVVDIAQRGRSLGVHMVLAAQTTRNAFTPAIRANTNLRIALRVADEAESEEVIASPLAARIPSGVGFRGRAFVRTGAGDGQLQEFQAAYVSGHSSVADHSELKIERFELVDAPASVARADSDLESDLLALGEAASAAQREMGCALSSPPWRPTLPELLPLEVNAPGEPQAGRVSIGLVDLPHLQRQEPLTLDFSAGHVAVFGAGHSGKTTALTTTALALANASTPAEVWIYGLDAGSGRLAEIDRLPHCGGVVMLDEEERVQRLLRMLVRRIESRDRTQSRIVLLLDDLGSFAQRYDRPGIDSPLELLHRVLAGGRAESVHAMLTVSRRGALTSALSAHVAQRLVLRMPTEEEMLSLGLDLKAVRGTHLPPGRGFTQDSREFHIALPMEGAIAIGTETAVSAVCVTDERRPPAIEVLPASISRDSLPQPASLDAVPLGIADEDMQPAFVDLLVMHFLVAGPYRSGRSTALATLAHGIAAADARASLHLLAPRRSPLLDLDHLWTTVASGLDACAQASASLLAQLEGDELGRAFVFVDDGGELTDPVSTAKLERLVRLGRDSKARVVTSVEMGAARGIGVAWIRELRREGHGLLLSADPIADGDLLGMRLPRSVVAPAPGRGFLVRPGSAQFIQVAY